MIKEAQDGSKRPKLVHNAQNGSNPFGSTKTCSARIKKVPKGHSPKSAPKIFQNCFARTKFSPEGSKCHTITKDTITIKLSFERPEAPKDPPSTLYIPLNTHY